MSGTKRSGEGVSREAAEALRRVKEQGKRLERLGEDLQRHGMDGLSGLRTDGLPRARGGLPRGLEAGLIKREALRRIIDRERAELRRMEEEARRLIDGVKPELYSFCALYYLSGLTLEETAEVMERSRRQVYRYKEAVERG